MKASVVQSLLIRNKYEITEFEKTISENQKNAKFLFSIEMEWGAKSFLKRNTKLRKKLAKLVEIQKALKAELQIAYEYEREEGFFSFFEMVRNCD